MTTNVFSDIPDVITSILKVSIMLIFIDYILTFILFRLYIKV